MGSGASHPQWGLVIFIAGQMLTLAALINVPPLVYQYASTCYFRGPAHWFSGGALVFAVGSSAGAAGY